MSWSLLTLGYTYPQQTGPGLVVLNVVQILLQNIFNRSQLPANPNRARILFGDQGFSLDTIINTNQNINYPQTRFVNAPDVSLDHNPTGRGGYFELPHR